MEKIRVRWLGALVAGVLGLTGAMTVVPAGVAVAAPTVVLVPIRADDGSPKSLRGVIDAINAIGGDVDWTVVLEPGDPYVIDRDCQDGDGDDNHGGDLDVRGGDVTFTTLGSGRATVSVECVGERAFHKFGVSTSIRFEGVRITGGNTADGLTGDALATSQGQAGGTGGAIKSQGSVELFDSELDHNSTGRGGAGARVFGGGGGSGAQGGAGGAVFAIEISVVRSTVHHNTTGAGGNGGDGTAGGDGGDGGDGGSGTLRAARIEVIESVVAGNALGDGGAGGAGFGAGDEGGRGGRGGDGGAAAATAMTIVGSTATNNTAGAGGDGGHATLAAGGSAGVGGSGGALAGFDVTVRSSTVHANSAGRGGAGGDGVSDGANGFNGGGGGLYVDDTGSIVFSTITANAADAGANVFAENGTSVAASVIGEAPPGQSNCGGGEVDLSRFSVVDDGSCGAADDSVSVVPALGLGVLEDNGGATPTRFPLLDGPLVSLIPADVCAGLAPDGWDQRGEPRPNGGCEPGAVEVGEPGPPGPPVGPVGASRFVPLAPARVFDTREPGPAAGYVAADTTRTVQFGGVAGIPADGVTAVAFNLTVTDAGGPGFVTASPSGMPRPLASNLNTVAAGQTVPNLVIVPLGADGRIDFYALTGGHLLADVLGYFEPAAGASAGRIEMLDPTRVFDTRESGPVAGKLAAGETLTIDVTGTAGVPDAGVSAVILNVTATGADAAGFVTAFGGGEVPLASTLNLVAAGATTSNLAIVPVAADGTVAFYTLNGTHLLADVMGYVTDATAPVATAGLFVAQQPARVFDTRDEHVAPLAAGTTIDKDMTASITDASAGVWVNLTGTQAQQPGYVTGWTAGKSRPLASNLNLTTIGETRANAALLPHNGDGATSFYTLQGLHVLADAYGYILGPPSPTDD